jgi:hypothetical protein
MKRDLSERQLRLSNYQGYFRGYLDLVPGSDFHSMFQSQWDYLPDYFRAYSADRQQYVYAESKWSPKTILQHIIDTERIMAYRALCIARSEEQHLPGFDENAYALQARAERRNWGDLIGEWSTIRISSQQLFASFDNDGLLREGSFSGLRLSVEGIGCLIAGHVQHHYRILEERYRI